LRRFASRRSRPAAAKHGRSPPLSTLSPGEPSKWAPSPAAARQQPTRAKQRPAPEREAGGRPRARAPKLTKAAPAAGARLAGSAGEPNWIIPSSSTNQRLRLTRSFSSPCARAALERKSKLQSHTRASQTQSGGGPKRDDAFSLVPLGKAEPSCSSLQPCGAGKPHRNPPPRSPLWYPRRLDVTCSSFPALLQSPDLTHRPFATLLFPDRKWKLTLVCLRPPFVLGQDPI
jgi:hypothetical protein